MAMIPWPPVSDELPWIRWSNTNVPSSETRLAMVWSIGSVIGMLCCISMDQNAIQIANPWVLATIAFLIVGTVWSCTTSVKIDNVPPSAFVFLIMDDWQGFYPVKGPFPRTWRFSINDAFCNGIAIMPHQRFSILFQRRDEYGVMECRAEVVFVNDPSPQAMRSFWRWWYTGARTNSLVTEGLEITVHQNGYSQHTPMPTALKSWYWGGGYDD